MRRVACAHDRVKGGGDVTEQTSWESFKLDGSQIVEKLRDLIHQGNIRRVIVQHEGRTVAEFPLTAGVVGVVLAPVLAAIGGLVALLKNCTIQVETVQAEQAGEERKVV
jgi:hypothetical protein